MVSKMSVTNKVSFGARIPAGKKVTAVHLFAEEQVKTSWCCNKLAFTPIMSIDLDTKHRHKISDTQFEYPDCRVKMNLEKIRELDADCCVRLKVKKGDQTIRKKIVNAKYLIKCLQEPDNMFAKVHVALEVFSFYPLTAALKIWTHKPQGPENTSTAVEVETPADETHATVMEATPADQPVENVSETIVDQPVQDVSDTMTDEPLETVPVACWDNLMMESISEAETDSEWEDVPSSSDDEGELKQDDQDENDKHPLQESRNTSCSEALRMNEEQTKHSNEEAAPVWVRMWRPVRRVVKLSVLGLLAVTAVLVVVEPMLPGLDDDNV